MGDDDAADHADDHANIDAARLRRHPDLLGLERRLDRRWSIGRRRRSVQRSLLAAVGGVGVASGAPLVCAQAVWWSALEERW